MLLQQLNRTDAEKVFVIGQNVSSGTIIGNGPVCWEGVIAATASYGNAFMSPITSNLSLFAGILDADVATMGFGLIQAYGARVSIAAFISNVSHSCAGYVLGPVAANGSMQSQGKSFQFGPVVVFDNAASGETYLRGLIRAL